MARHKKILLFHLTPFDKYKLVRVEEMIQRENINPLKTTIYNSNGEMRFTPADIRNYHMKHTKRFNTIIGKGKLPWQEKIFQAV